MIKQLITIFCICISSVLFAQNNAFTYGEQLTFTASYKVSGLMTDVAQVKMETSLLNVKNNKLMRLKCTASTYSSFDSYFKVRDLYESYVNPKSIKPYLYNREIDEGGHYKDVSYRFNQKTRKVKTTIKQKSPNFKSGFWVRKSTVNIGPNSRDLVSTLYHLRTLDIKKAPIGASDSFTIFFDAKEKKCSFKLLAKENIKTAIGTKLCYKLAINFSGTVLKGYNKNIIWLTADENKIPVKAKFSIAVGQGELKIKSAKGLKHN